MLPGEDAELENQGMCGMSLGQYLLDRLPQRGYDSCFLCWKDWGLVGELPCCPFTFGVCIYGRDPGDGRLDLYVTDSATGNRRLRWRSSGSSRPVRPTRPPRRTPTCSRSSTPTRRSRCWPPTSTRRSWPMMASVRDPGSDHLRVGLGGRTWPHGFAGTALPHGAVFSR